MHIRAKAPLRISFAGGGTDVSPFPEQEGGHVLSATIDRYAYGTLSPRSDQIIGIESVDLNVTAQLGLGEDLAAPEGLGLVQAALSRLGNRYAGGYDIFLRTSAPPGSGLGSSSALMVVLVGLLREHHRYGFTDYEIASLAHQMERYDLGIVGGKQDHYASTFGGFNFIEFGADHVLVNPLRVHGDTLNELEHNLVLVYTGVTRASSQIIEDQTARVVDKQVATVDGLRRQKQLALDMKSALLRGELHRFGELLDVAWESKRQLSPKISTEKIDELYALAKDAGALGGKVTGAGGGGYILFYCPFRKRHKVCDALEHAGASINEVGFSSAGLTTWTSRDV